jgi:hypothetical protein
MKRVSLPLMFVAFAGCGDPMVPSNFSGPPAAALKGNVLPGKPGTADAERPRMSLEWLDRQQALVGQSLSYQRSDKLQTDWDIGLALPQETAKFNTHVGTSAIRIGVAKIVYFDDRDGDDKLDWSCQGAGCDRVMAISSQFVLFVEKPPYCRSFQGGDLKPRLTAGYHYYAFEGDLLREVPASDPMSFSLIDRQPVDSDPTADLQAFAEKLLQIWFSSLDNGC